MKESCLANILLTCSWVAFLLSPGKQSWPVQAVLLKIWVSEVLKTQVKLSAEEMEYTGERVRHRATLPYILILKYRYGPVKLLGFSRTFPTLAKPNQHYRFLEIQDI